MIRVMKWLSLVGSGGALGAMGIAGWERWTQIRETECGLLSRSERLGMIWTADQIMHAMYLPALVLIGFSLLHVVSEIAIRLGRREQGTD